MPEQNERQLGMLLPGDAAQPNHVPDQQVETARPEVSETSTGGHGTAVSAVIVTVDRHADCHQGFDQGDVPADVFTHPVGNLHPAPYVAPPVPSGACDVQSVSAAELELARSP